VYISDDSLFYEMQQEIVLPTLQPGRFIGPPSRPDHTVDLDFSAPPDAASIPSDLAELSTTFSYARPQLTKHKAVVSASKEEAIGAFVPVVTECCPTPLPANIDTAEVAFSASACSLSIAGLISPKEKTSGDDHPADSDERPPLPQTTAQTAETIAPRPSINVDVGNGEAHPAPPPSNEQPLGATNDKDPAANSSFILDSNPSDAEEPATLDSSHAADAAIPATIPATPDSRAADAEPPAPHPHPAPAPPADDDAAEAVHGLLDDGTPVHDPRALVDWPSEEELLTGRRRPRLLARWGRPHCVWAWGNGHNFQLGDGSFRARALPAPVDRLCRAGVVDLAGPPPPPPRRPRRPPSRSRSPPASAPRAHARPQCSE
jgi:hypothetical protein